MDLCNPCAKKQTSFVTLQVPWLTRAKGKREQEHTTQSPVLRGLLCGFHAAQTSNPFAKVGKRISGGSSHKPRQTKYGKPMTRHMMPYWAWQLFQAWTERHVSFDIPLKVGTQESLGHSMFSPVHSNWCHRIIVPQGESFACSFACFLRVRQRYGRQLPWQTAPVIGFNLRSFRLACQDLC